MFSPVIYLWNIFNNDSLEEDANITEIESDFMQDSLHDQLNGGLEAIGGSPAKIHGVPKHGCLSYANVKFDKTTRAIKQHISSAIGASATEISLPSEEPSGSVGIEQKAKDLDQLMEDINGQIAVSTFRRRIQLLTLAPKSWKIRYKADCFDFLCYLVQKAFKLRDDKGICSIPPKKGGKLLPLWVITNIRQFYQGDQNSRLLPGKKGLSVYSYTPKLHNYTGITPLSRTALAGEWAEIWGDRTF